MTDSWVELEIRSKERVGLLWLDNPPENRLHPKLVKRLMQLLDQMEAQAEIGSLLLAGNNAKYFCTGLDLDWVKQHESAPDTIYLFLLEIQKLYHRLVLYPKPIVGVLNGHTIGGGLLLAACLDFRLMRKDRGFVCLPGVNINLPLSPGMIALCQASMTGHGFRRLYYLGERLTGLEALKIGFVDQVLEQEKLLPQATQLAAKLATKKQKTYAEMKQRLNAPLAQMLIQEDLRYFQNAFFASSYL